MLLPGSDIIIGNPVGLAVLIAIIVVAAIIAVQAPIPVSLRALIVVALVLRVVGAVARLYALLVIYHGVGDAMGYFRNGVHLADRITHFDFTVFVDSNYWWQEEWLGTTPVYWVSGIVVSLIGPSILGEFIVFSLLSFLGLVAFALAFKRSFPSIPVSRYARWIWLFPSLWYWPSSVGKEALCLLGIGLGVVGVIGKGGRIHWTPLVAGLGLVFIIRPQLAALFFAAAIIAHWLGTGERWTAAKSYQAVGIGIFSLVVIVIGLRTAGVQSFDMEGIEGYIVAEGSRAIGGGSAIEAPPIGITGVPRAFMNVLMRPFPWEGASPPTMLAAAEVATLWIFVLLRRRQLLRALSGWRQSPLLCLSFMFVILYAASLGMMVANLGIIARQRIFLFPFIFVFLEGIPAARAITKRPRTRLPVLRAPHPARTGEP